ncbi:hypothetical protein [Streptosporangium saharense]|uniref:hypothetical protein n=1 Tax=Streptosporangium saharense TaxID=1706840 RepID=UPI0036A5B0F3
MNTHTADLSFGCTIGFARDLARDIDLVRELAFARTTADDINLVHELAQVLARVSEIARLLEFEVDRARGVTKDLDFACDTAHNMAIALNFAQYLDHPTIGDPYLSIALAFVSPTPIYHHLTREIDFHLARARDSANDIALRLESYEQASSTMSQPAEERMHVAVSASWLVSLQMRLLPPQHRSRYGEELQAELHYLAQAKATPAMQILYALQQLSRVWAHRAALQAPDRPRFYRLHRTACWVLATEWRTWGTLGPLLVAGVINIHLSQGWGSALFTLPGIVAFYAGVEWLRKRWGVEVKSQNWVPRDPPSE